MRSETAADASRAATTLGLDELLAMRPLRVLGARPRGARGPGGERPGRGRAQSLDFEGLSPYAPGDDVRWIDWRASARSGETQMRRFAAESHRARMIVLDLRPDLYFGLAERFLAKSAALAAARLAWEADALQEPVGLSAPGAAMVEPRRGRRNVAALLASVAAAYEAGREDGGASIAARLEAAAAALRPRDEIHMIGDFEREDPALDETARRLSTRLSLFAWVVEDRAVSAPAPHGRYPMFGRLGARLVAAVDRAGGRRAPEAAARLQTDRRARLRAAGWEPMDALDLLPRAAA